MTYKTGKKVNMFNRKSCLFSLLMILFWLSIVCMLISFILLLISNFAYAMLCIISIILMIILPHILNSDYFDEDNDNDVYNSK